MKIPLPNECNPGIQPVEYNVLVAPYEIEKVSKGGIIFTDRQTEVEGLAVVRGVLIEVSPLAFTYDDWPAESRKPQVGDHVIFSKYKGILLEGDDGREYRLLKDKEIGAIITTRTDAMKAAA